MGRDLGRQLLPSAVPAETKQYIDTLIPNDKRRREAVHQYISHLTSMQAEVVTRRAANEWQDKVVQRRVVDRQPEAVRAFKQCDWVVHRHFGNRRPTKCHLFGLVIISLKERNGGSSVRGFLGARE